MQEGIEGTPAFRPAPASAREAQLQDFIAFLTVETGVEFPSYDAFCEFARTDFRTFWRCFLTWSGIAVDGNLEPTCLGDDCETARFFPDLSLSYAENLLSSRIAQDDEIAITSYHHHAAKECMTRGELRLKVEKLAAFLRRHGIGPGHRVAAIVRNNAEAIIAALAAAAVGAPFSSCAPDMGAASIMARLEPLQPSVLFGHFAAPNWEQGLAGGERMSEVAGQLSSLEMVITLDDGLPAADLRKPLHFLVDILAEPAEHANGQWPRLPFDHPLFIMFSSGTTGRPKCIVHGAGGTLIEHVKEHRLHCDLRPGDKLFFQTSCAWMMWNWQLSALASGVQLVLYDGPVNEPSGLWRLVAQEEVTVFGTSPSYISLCSRAGISPRELFDFPKLRSVLSTGSILYPAQFDWIESNVKSLPVQSISGGTDIIGCFVLGNPILPVHRGEAQCRSIGLDVHALSESGRLDEGIGELVCTNPFPSRPVAFYGDPDGEAFHNAYFSQNPGVWTHGDLIEFSPQGGARIHGRSDGVMNVKGVRVGPAEVYRILQEIEPVAEALVVEQHAPEGRDGSRMVLLVVLRDGAALDDALVRRIRSALLERGSSALVPARIAQVGGVPRTFSGKYSETAASDVLNGRPVRNLAALVNPECLEEIRRHPALSWTDAAERWTGQTTEVGSVAPRDALDVVARAVADALGLATVEPNESIHDLGLDSLAIVSLAKRLEQQFGHPLPVARLFSAGTVQAIADLLASDVPDDDREEPDDRQGLPSSGTAGVSIRPAAPEDISKICELLSSGFGQNRVEPGKWRSLIDYQWFDQRPSPGYVLVDGNKIVGFLGIIYARRKLGDRHVLTANLTSWYVLPDYRGWGAVLIDAAVRDQSINFTALTPAPLTRTVLERLGFQPAASRKRVFLPFMNPASALRRRPEIITDVEVIRRYLEEPHLTIFEQHLPYDCCHVLVRDCGESAYMVFKRRGVNRKRSTLKSLRAELLYCSNGDLLSRHLERIKWHVMWKLGPAVLVVDESFFTSTPPLSIVSKNNEMYRGPEIGVFIRDKLYSEIVVLGV